jgi:hypothetical protein
MRACKEGIGSHHRNLRRDEQKEICTMEYLDFERNLTALLVIALPGLPVLALLSYILWDKNQTRRMAVHWREKWKDEIDTRMETETLLRASNIPDNSEILLRAASAEKEPQPQELLRASALEE